MYNTKNATYHRARAVKKGEIKLASNHQEIIDWVSSQFNVRALDFSFETKNISESLHQQVITIILERIVDCTNINSPPNCELIAERFITYFKTVDRKAESDPSKQDVWPFPSNPFPEIIIGFDPLEAIEWRVAWERAWPEIYKLQNQFDFIYTILVNQDSQAIFFYKDDQCTEANKKVVLDALLVLLKKHDEFGYFGLASFSITTYFDSKENLDKNYGGDPLH